MTYTDKYLIHNITNKQFKRKYKPESNIKPMNETWKQRILRKNSWLKEPMFDSLQPADQAHLDSIRAESSKIDISGIVRKQQQRNLLAYWHLMRKQPKSSI